MSDTIKASDVVHVNHSKKWGGFGFTIGNVEAVLGAASTHSDSDAMKNKIDFIVIAVAAGVGLLSLVAAIAQLFGWRP